MSQTCKTYRRDITDWKGAAQDCVVCRALYMYAVMYQGTVSHITQQNKQPHNSAHDLLIQSRELQQPGHSFISHALQPLLP